MLKAILPLYESELSGQKISQLCIKRVGAGGHKK